MMNRLDTTLMKETVPTTRPRPVMRQVPAFVLLVLAVYAVANGQFSPASLIVIALAGVVAAIVAESNRPWHPRPQLATPGPREPWFSDEPSSRLAEEGGYSHAR